MFEPQVTELAKVIFPVVLLPMVRFLAVMLLSSA